MLSCCVLSSFLHLWVIIEIFLAVLPTVCLWTCLRFLGFFLLGAAIGLAVYSLIHLFNLIRKLSLYHFLLVYDIIFRCLRFLSRIYINFLGLMIKQTIWGELLANRWGNWNFLVWSIIQQMRWLICLLLQLLPLLLHFVNPSSHQIPMTELWFLIILITWIITLIWLRRLVLLRLLTVQNKRVFGI